MPDIIRSCVCVHTKPIVCARTPKSESREEATMAKTVLITGASSGIGLAAAVAAAEAGWTTIATLRDTGKAEALRKAATEADVADRVHVRRLDVVDPELVTACIDGVIAEFGQLDAVVNNAGVGQV